MPTPIFPFLKQVWILFRTAVYTKWIFDRCLLRNDLLKGHTGIGESKNFPSYCPTTFNVCSHSHIRAVYIELFLSINQFAEGIYRKMRHISAVFITHANFSDLYFFLVFPQNWSHIFWWHGSSINHIVPLVHKRESFQKSQPKKSFVPQFDGVKPFIAWQTIQDESSIIFISVLMRQAMMSWLIFKSRFS